jgi:hypothetical protein
MLDALLGGHLPDRKRSSLDLILDQRQLLSPSLLGSFLLGFHVPTFLSSRGRRLWLIA